MLRCESQRVYKNNVLTTADYLNREEDIMFKVWITVTDKLDDFNLPIWDKTQQVLDGDKNDVKNLIKQLQLVKQDVNQFVAIKQKLPLSRFDIKIQFVN